MITDLRIKILPNTKFLLENGKYDLDKSLNYSGRIGGICYSQDGLEACLNEDDEKTNKRVDGMTRGGHQSVFEHNNISLYIKGPKIMNMVLNNEGQYSTSERSFRYTKIDDNNESLSEKEIELYNKWYQKFYDIISTKHPEFGKFKTRNLARENARYMISVFTDTEMVHTVPLAQLNREITFAKKYIEDNKDSEDAFVKNMSNIMKSFIEETDRLNLHSEKFDNNFKSRGFRLFGKNLEEKEDYFGDVYSYTYPLSYAAFADNERHRTIEYQIERDNNLGYYVPEILKEEGLADEWLEDIKTVSKIYPQGELVRVHENSSMDRLIAKMEERECTAVLYELWDQIEVMRQKYLDSLEKKDSNRKEEFKQYTKGFRCTFPGFTCPTPCGRAGLKRDV